MHKTLVLAALSIDAGVVVVMSLGCYHGVSNSYLLLLVLN